MAGADLRLILASAVRHLDELPQHIATLLQVLGAESNAIAAFTAVVAQTLRNGEAVQSPGENITVALCGEGPLQLARSLEDSVLDHFQIAIHIKRIGLAPRGPDADGKVWPRGIGAVE